MLAMWPCACTACRSRGVGSPCYARWQVTANEQLVGPDIALAAETLAAAAQMVNDLLAKAQRRRSAASSLGGLPTPSPLASLA